MLEELENTIGGNNPTALPGKPPEDTPWRIPLKLPMWAGKETHRRTRRAKQKTKKQKVITVVDDNSTTRSKGFDELNHKIDQLKNVVNSFAPVIQELKTSYDAALREDS